MANKNYVFGSHPLGYGIKSFCSKCKHEITSENALEVKTRRGTYLGYGVCSEEGDDEGRHWRAFCHDCFAEVQNLPAETVFNSYPASEWYDEDEVIK